jgi:SNF2 family DNA or RNA helicase
MTELPDMTFAPTPVVGAPARDPYAGALKLQPHMDYKLARAVPGAIYSPQHKGVVLPMPTPRSAIVALALKPSLGLIYPELEELRDSLLADVRPTDYATQLGIGINAPTVARKLHEQGHDWLQWPELAGEDGLVPSQETDLGYAAAVLNKHGAFYLAWARGLGKTLGTAAIIEANGYDRVLVSAPNTAKVDTWKRELETFLPTHPVFIMPNEKAKRERLLERIKAGRMPERYVLVTHHESLAIIAGRKDRPSGRGKTVLDGWHKLGVTWDLFAVDEGHRLANETAQLHRAAVKVLRRHALVLSGSVYQNNWEELFGPLHFMYPQRYARKWEDWNLRHFEYVQGYSKVWVGLLPGHDQVIRDELGVFMIVREKTSKAVSARIDVDLRPAQRRAYDELVDDYVTQLDDGTAILAEAGVAMLTRLRQVASGLELLTHRLSASSKLDAAVEKILKYPEDDYFVAVWYKASAYALRDRLEAEGLHAWVITGDVDMKARGPIIEQTREAAARKPLYAQVTAQPPVVLIGTIPTLGESVNLQHLNHVIRIDRSWNPALNRQVVDRVDRTGQTRTVYLDDIVAKDTVDELVVMPNLANKDAFRAMVLGRPA